MTGLQLVRTRRGQRARHMPWERREAGIRAAACCLLRPDRARLARLAQAQVLRAPPAEVHELRRRVVALSEHLNRRTVQVVQTFMPRVEDASLAPPQAELARTQL